MRVGLEFRKVNGGLTVVDRNDLNACSPSCQIRSAEESNSEKSVWKNYAKDKKQAESGLLCF